MLFLFSTPLSHWLRFPIMALLPPCQYTLLFWDRPVRGQKVSLALLACFSFASFGSKFATSWSKGSRIGRASCSDGLSVLSGLASSVSDEGEHLYELYRERARKYVERQKELLTGPDAARSFYKHVRAYSAKEKPPDFDPCSLFPDLGEGEVAEKLAEHFNKISDEFQGIGQDEIPVAMSMPLPKLTTEDVKLRLLSIKKPRSMVPGDIFRELVTRGAAYLACPLASIFNNISEHHVWPALWKVEYCGKR